MSEAVGDSTQQAEFEALAKTNINAWLVQFLSQVNNTVSENDEDEDEDEDHCLDISQADEYREFGADEKVLGLHIEEVDSEGGHEGGGDHAEIIFAVKKGEEIITHFRITGYYCSYEGTEWSDEVDQVEPREVMVTQWFATDGSED